MQKLFLKLIRREWQAIENTTKTSKPQRINTLKNIEAKLENLETRMTRLEDFGAMAEQDIKPPNDSNTQMNK